MTNNIMFLDIDGVLNNINDHIEATSGDFTNAKTMYINYGEGLEQFGVVNKLKLAKLQSIVKDFNVKVYLISSWIVVRHLPNVEFDLEGFLGFEYTPGYYLDADGRLSFALNTLNKLGNYTAVYLDDDDRFTIPKPDNVDMLMIHPVGVGLTSENFDEIRKYFEDNTKSAK